MGDRYNLDGVGTEYTLDDDSHMLFEDDFIEQTREAIGHRADDVLFELVSDLHPADIASLLSQLSRAEVAGAVSLLEPRLSAETLTELDDDLREVALDAITDQSLISLLETLDSDDATMLISVLDERRQRLLLDQVSATERAAIETSLQFDEETAGRLMQRDFVAAPEFWSVGQAIDHMRRQSDKLPDTFFEVYLVDPGFHLTGAVSLSDLICETRDVLLKDIRVDLTAAVKADMDQEEVAYLFQKYNLASAPVVDVNNRLTGMITIDDMVDVIQEENKEDLLALSQVSEGGARQTVAGAVKSRAPWLAINVLTAFLASAAISIFEPALKEIVALAVLMPVVAALGGNAGSQALAVTVRAMAEREMVGPNVIRAVRREVLTALINGVLFATGVGLVTLVWFSAYDLALVIAVAMFFTFVWAGLNGVLVPLTLRKLGADPAVASSVFVLTFVDVAGFCMFLGLATKFLL